MLGPGLIPASSFNPRVTPSNGFDLLETCLHPSNYNEKSMYLKGAQRDLMT